VSAAAAAAALDLQTMHVKLPAIKNLCLLYLLQALSTISSIISWRPIDHPSLDSDFRVHYLWSASNGRKTTAKEGSSPVSILLPSAIRISHFEAADKRYSLKRRFFLICRSTRNLN
jgi:hypothetical protein